jgi:hypothetical protein
VEVDPAAGAAAAPPGRARERVEEVRGRQESGSAT